MARRSIAALLATTALLSVLVAVAPVPGLTGVAEAADTVIELRATDVRIAIGSERINPGRDVQWRNRSGRTLAVTSPDGVLDSGPIPDGGSFYASLPVPRSYPWETEVGGGTLYTTAEFLGAPGDLANESIPDVVPPPVPASDITLHPTLRIELPRNRMLVGFTDDATVAQAEAALGNDWVVVGGLPLTQLVYIERRSPSTVFPTSQITSLRAKPGVEFVSYLFPIETSALPPASAEVNNVAATWENPAIAPDGFGLNYNMELSRLPQAWNLLDSLAADGAMNRATTLILDDAFERHDDLNRLEIVQSCTAFGLTCSTASASTEPTDHGNHVAGIIGADHDEWGVSGADPFSRLLGFPWQFGEGLEYRGDLHLAVELLARRLTTRDPSDRLTRPDVINMSIQNDFSEAGDWWARWDGETCGPGIDDDATGTDVCTPSNEDGHLFARAEAGRAFRRQIQWIVIANAGNVPLFVVSTGNASDTYCRTLRGDQCTSADTIAQDAALMGSPMTWTERNWNPDDWPELGSTPPIISVESLGDTINKAVTPNRSRSPFSNINGDISAGGWALSTASKVTEAKNPCQTGTNPAATTQTYCALGGTSMAAPVVSGIAGLLVAADPTLDAYGLRAALLDWAVADTTDGASPRADAFASMLSLPGAARRLVDVNDPSADGNRRVVRDSTGTEVQLDVTSSTSADRSTEPDGAVDLRDFRRFRDAWLLGCTIDPEEGCPTEIALDGPDDHPKFDLNLDGCVARIVPAVGLACASELTFPRFDFNGDGTLSQNARSLMPLRSDGTPATRPDQATSMTDLDVFRSQWDADAEGSMGVDADSLVALLASGDVTAPVSVLRAAAGTPDVAVRVVDAQSGTVIADTALGADTTVDDVVFTIPINRPVRIIADGIGPGAATAEWGAYIEQAGTDCTLGSCSGLTITAPRTVLRPGESMDVTVTITGGGSIDQVPVDVDIDPVEVAGASLTGGVAALQVLTGPNGAATIEVTAGPTSSNYTISATATVEIRPGVTTTRTVRFDFAVADAYEVDAVAVDGAGSGYALLNERARPGDAIGPSVNGLGDVAFGGLVVADDRYRVFIAPQGSTPTDPLTTEQGIGTATDEFVVDDVEINDARQVVYTVSRLVGGDVETTIRRSTGTTTVDFDTASTADAFAGPFISVGRPTMNASGRVVHVGNDGASFVSSLAERVGADVATGLSSLGLRPRLADDGTTVTDIAVERRCTEHPERTCSAPEATADQFFDTAIVAGDGVQALGSFTIAEQRIDGWGGLSDPDISPSGDAIVFTGERNGLVGTFLALRDPATGWQEPLAIAGPAAGASAIADVEGSRPNVTQVSRGAAGPVDDLFVVVMVGRASPTGALGAHALRLIVDATPDPAVPFAVSIEGSDPVIEVGDDVLGSTVDSVVLADSVAAATAPTHVFDHWVAVHVRLADDRNAIVRARSLTPPIPPVVALSAPVAAPQGFRAAGLSSPVSPAAALLAAPVAPALLAADLVVLPGPHVAAVTVDDDTPTARVTTRVTNRSRTLDGTPASAVLDEGGVGTLKVLANPLLLGPDESTTLELPDTGAPNFAIGAPVTAGGDANDVSFSFAVEKGANRPPTGSLTGAPYTILDGEGLSLPVVTADPDGDSRSVTWDLDADGAYDDGTFSLNLTGAQVAALICGGSCVLDTPYPIAARVLDARGLDTILTSTVTITSPGAIDLQVQPTLVRINPGQSGTLYVDLSDSTGSLPARVSTTTENLPAGWSTNLSSTITTGTVASVRISVPAGEAEGSFTFDIVGRLGAEEWRRPVTVVTQFGLIPRCTTQIGGIIVDDSDTPINGATVTMTLGRVLTARTGADGRFRMAYLALDPELSQGFELERISSWRVSAADYVSATLPAFTVECDGTTELTATLRPLTDLAGMTVRTVSGIENPVQPSRPLSTGEPVDGATVTFAQSDVVITGVDGRADSGPVAFEDITGSRPPSIPVRVEKAGFWPVTRSVSTIGIDPSEILDAGDVVLLPQCTATLTGGRVVDQNGDPVEGAAVGAVTTGADGRYILDQTVLLGTWNTATSRIVRATAPAAWATGDSDQLAVRINRCGESVSVPTLRLDRPAVPDPDLFGDLVGTVTDVTSGGPLAGATVRAYPAGPPAAELGRATVQPDGSWSIPGLFVGTDPTGARSLRIETTKSGYWRDTRPVSLPANATGASAVVVNITQLQQQRVSIRGTVTDIDTGDPIVDVDVFTSGSSGPAQARTDAAGNYVINDLLLDEGNQPFATRVLASFGLDPRTTPRITHWPTDRPYTLSTADDQVVDLQMVPICASSSISGTVFDASTLQPINGATVFAGGSGDTTDADGRYRIDGIRPDQLNAPRNVYVLAQAPGFFDSSVTVTTVCGSELVVDFGRPPAGFGTVRGTVVDGNDAPLAEVDVGTPWGDAVTTGADGTFLFDRAPLAADGGDRVWTIIAVDGPRTLRRDATVSASADAIVTFRFTDEPDPQNRAPVVEVAALGTLTEGDVVTFDASSTTDPDGDDMTFAWTLLDGDGVVATGSGPMWTYDSTDDFVGTIRLVVTDAQEASTTVERPVVVTNAAPSVAISNATVTPVTSALRMLGIEPISAALTTATVELRASFTDPGVADTHTVTVEWGDGAAETVGHQAGLIVANHAYAASGSFTIIVRVCDDDLGCAQATRLIDIPDATDPAGTAPTTPTPAPPIVIPTTPIAQPPAATPPPPGADPATTLPETGGDAAPLLALSLSLLLLGFVLTLTTRRRRHA